MPHAPRTRAWATLEDAALAIHRDDGGSDRIQLRDVIAVLPAGAQGGGAAPSGFRLLSIQPPTDEEAADFVLNKTELASLPASVLQTHLLLALPSHLAVSRDQHQPDPPNLHVVVSTRSGRCQAEAFFARIARPVLDAVGLAEHAYRLHRTDSDRSVAAFALQQLGPRANAGATQTVLLLSGDGGVVDLVNGLLQGAQGPAYRAPSIGLLVLGTGNALANSCGLNHDGTKGLAALLRGAPRPLPTFAARFSPGSALLVDEGRASEPLPADGPAAPGTVHGAVVCSWGLHASLVADSDTAAYRQHGAARFAMAARALLAPPDGSPPHAYRGRITLFRPDGGRGEERAEPLAATEHGYLLATLVARLEAGFTVSPASRRLDGRLRLLRFGPVAADEVVRLLGLAYAGGAHVAEPAVLYGEVAGLRIDFDEPDARWRRVCVDGKIVRVGEGGWMEVRREGRHVVDLVVDGSG
jgi:diacylglycerol kinase family enzyme